MRTEADWAIMMRFSRMLRMQQRLAVVDPEDDEETVASVRTALDGMSQIMTDAVQVRNYLLLIETFHLETFI